MTKRFAATSQIDMYLSPFFLVQNYGNQNLHRRFLLTEENQKTLI